MGNLLKKFQKWWIFTIANPVVRKGESADGAFKWVFRRYTLEISTFSGNWKARWTAAEHPFGYLLCSNDKSKNIEGFCQVMYMLGSLLTSDQGLCDDVAKALAKYQKRLEKAAAGEVKEDEIEEKVALEETKGIQEYVDASPKEKRKMERDINGRFRKAVKKSQNGTH